LKSGSVVQSTQDVKVEGAKSPSEAELVAHVAQQLGKPLAPRHVFVVEALPKTRSGKIVRASIARAFLGQPMGDLASVENPQALDAIATLAHSQPV